MPYVPSSQFIRDGRIRAVGLPPLTHPSTVFFYVLTLRSVSQELYVIDTATGTGPQCNTLWCDLKVVDADGFLITFPRRS